MPPTNPINAPDVNRALDNLDAEIAEIAGLQREAVFAQFANGLAGTDIAGTWKLGSLDDIRFRLIYVRAHFTGGSGTNPLIISIDSVQGSQFDTTLATVSGIGHGSDLNYMVAQEESKNPSPWSFGIGDLIRVDWAAPDAFGAWGLEIGLAPAL